MKTVVSIKAAANMLGVNIQTLRIWDNEGKFKAIKTVGKHRRYKVEDIQKFLNKQV